MEVIVESTKKISLQQKNSGVIWWRYWMTYCQAILKKILVWWVGLIDDKLFFSLSNICKRGYFSTKKPS